MGESANTAFYAIVYAKRLVPPDRLQKALNKAMLEGLPLEKVVVSTGLLSPQECQSILRMRGQLGRVCRDCGETTYLLPDQDEATTPCEFCGGRFLQQAQRRGAQPQQQRPPTNPKASQRHVAATARPPSTKLARPPSQPVAHQGVGPDQLAVFRDQVVGEALRAVETKLAQEDLQGTLNRLVQEAVTRVSLQVGQQLGQQVNSQLAQLLGPQLEQHVNKLNQKLTDQVGELVRRELEGLQLDSLETRVTSQALRAIQEQASEGPGGADPAAIEAAVRQAVGELQPQGNEDVRELQAQVDAMANRLTQAQQAMLKDDLEQRVADLEERLGRAQEAMQQGDLGALAERLGLLEASQDQSTAPTIDPTEVGLIVQEQLAACDVAGLVQRAVDAASAGSQGRGGLDAEEVSELAARQARHAAQEVVGEVVSQQLAQLDTGHDTQQLREEVAALRQEIAAAAAAAGSGSGDATRQVELLRQEVAEQLAGLQVDLENQVHAGVDSQVERIAEEAALRAAQPIRKSVEIQLADLDLQNLPERIRAQVQADLASSSAGVSGSGSIDVEHVVKRVMNQVETRLAEFDMAAEMAISDASRQALEAVEERLSRLEEHSNEGTALGEGTRATLERLEHEQRALTKALRGLQEKGGKGGKGGLDKEQVQALVARGVEQAMALHGAGTSDSSDKLDRRAVRAAEEVREDMQTLRAELSASLEEFTAWAEERFNALDTAGGGGSGSVSHDQLEDILGAARAAAEAMVEERVGSGDALPPQGQTGSYNKKFVALAREVKALKERVEASYQTPSEERRSELEQGRSVVNSPEFKSLLEVRLKAALDKKLGDTGTFRTTTTLAAAPTAGQTDEAAAVNLLNSVAFKSMFDTKINEVLRYLKMDLVPSIVKRTLREVESK
ncbi:MAG: hypothetical protein R3F62_25025 [Planctomycetota bacterium]